METCRHTKISTQSSKLGVSCRSLYASPDDGEVNNNDMTGVVINMQNTTTFVTVILMSFYTTMYFMAA